MHGRRELTRTLPGGSLSVPVSLGDSLSSVCMIRPRKGSGPSQFCVLCPEGVRFISIFLALSGPGAHLPASLPHHCMTGPGLVLPIVTWGPRAESGWGSQGQAAPSSNPVSFPLGGRVGAWVTPGPGRPGAGGMDSEKMEDKGIRTNGTGRVWVMEGRTQV